MPTPSKGEGKGDFLKRCIPMLVKEGKENEQAVAVCISIWNESKKEKK